jgi:hypothetical protein
VSGDGQERPSTRVGAEYGRGRCTVRRGPAGAVKPTACRPRRAAGMGAGRSSRGADGDAGKRNGGRLAGPANGEGGAAPALEESPASGEGWASPAHALEEEFGNFFRGSKRRERAVLRKG